MPDRHDSAEHPDGEMPHGRGGIWNSMINWWHRRNAIRFFKELDEQIWLNLKDGSIKLIRAEFLRSGALNRIKRRQELEALEKEQGLHIFVPAKQAVKLLKKSKRKIGVLTYGWNTPGDPDPTGTYLAAVCRFLLSGMGEHVEALFWDYASLPQSPRTVAEESIFEDALECMGGLYASALGTTVLRHASVPARPSELDGEILVFIPPPETCPIAPLWGHAAEHDDEGLDDEDLVLQLVPSAQAKPSVCQLCESFAGPFYECPVDECGWKVCYACCERDSTIKELVATNAPEVEGACRERGDVLSFAHVSGRCWCAKFDSHAQAVAAVEELNKSWNGALAGSYSYCRWNSRPYFADTATGEAGRGWTTFESSVASEVFFRVKFVEPVRKCMLGLPPKIIEIDRPAGPAPAVIDLEQDMLTHSSQVRAAISAARFTGKGDKQKVVNLYHEYVVNIANAVTNFCNKLSITDGDGDSHYEGEENDYGQPHGFGVLTSDDGTGYRGEWKAGDYHGQGTLRHATGDVYEGEWGKGEEHGYGKYTMADGYIYVGEWLKGVIQGNGTVWEATGSVYQGQWKDSARAGKGTNWAEDGDTYVGQWKSGQFEGFGLCYGEHGDVVAARWKHDEPIGMGVAWADDRESIWKVKFIEHSRYVAHEKQCQITHGEARALLEKLVGRASRVDELFGPLPPPEKPEVLARPRDEEAPSSIEVQVDDHTPRRTVLPSSYGTMRRFTADM